MPSLPLRVAAAGLAAASVAMSAAVPGATERLDTRALWVVRTSLESPAAVRTMVRAAVDAGFTTLLIQVRGRGEAYYRSEVEPRASAIASPDDFDPLALALDLAHDAGLSVHAWLNVNLVASATTPPASPRHVAARHPEWLMVPQALARELGAIEPSSPGYVGRLATWTRRASDRVEGLYLSPITADAQAHTVAVVRELVDRYPIDGLHLDYVRYPGEEFDYSRAALAEFRAAELGHLSAEARARLDAGPIDAWAAARPEAWTAFRRDRLTTLVGRLAATARALKPTLAVSAAVVPRPAEARDRKFQDWVAWAARGHLDVVCPMLYTPDMAIFEDELQAAREAAPGTALWAGIGVYRLSAWRAATQVRLAREGGASGVALFSYDSLAAQRDGGSAYLAYIGEALRDPDSGTR